MTTPPSRQPHYAEWVQVIRERVCEGMADEHIITRYHGIPPAFIVVIASALRRADTAEAQAKRLAREVGRLEAQVEWSQHPFFRRR